MTSPLVSSFHHIHQAIGGELLKLEAHAEMLDPTNPESIGGFAGHFGMLSAIQEAHSHEEEGVLWPEITARNPGMMATFELDHEAEREYMAEIKSALDRLLQVGGNDTAGLAGRVYRNTIALSAHLIHHMEKEEALPYATVAGQLSDDEEIVLVGRVLSGLPDEMLPQAMPWWASYQSAEDIAVNWDITARALPAEKARLFAVPIVNSLSPEKWAEVQKLRPQLAEFRQS